MNIREFPQLNRCPKYTYQTPFQEVLLRGYTALDVGYKVPVQKLWPRDRERSILVGYRASTQLCQVPLA
jgi:hypothetical protein